MSCATLTSWLLVAVLYVSPNQYDLPITPSYRRTTAHKPAPELCNSFSDHVGILGAMTNFPLRSQARLCIKRKQLQLSANHFVCKGRVQRYLQKKQTNLTSSYNKTSHQLAGEMRGQYERLGSSHLCKSWSYFLSTFSYGENACC